MTKLSFKTKLIAGIAAVSVLTVAVLAQQLGVNYAAGVGTIYLNDVNGNAIFQAASTSSAVNFLKFTNSATGVAPTLGVGGSDTNIGLALTPKGTTSVSITNGTDPTKQALFSLSGATTGTATTLTFAQTTARTVTFPDASIGLLGLTFADCATTAACPSTAKTTLHVVQGIGLMATGSPSTYAVTAISPAFTSSTSYECGAQDVTTIANNIGVLTAGYVSGSAVTFTGPNTNTDTFRFWCIGY